MKRGGPLRRTGGLKRTGGPSRTGRLRPMSAKRAGERDERRAVIEQVIARDGAACKARDLVPEVECSGPLDADEYDQRGVRPGGHLDPTNVQMLCRFGHHRWVTENQVEAARRGLKPFPRNYALDDGHTDRQMPL